MTLNNRKIKNSQRLASALLIFFFNIAISVAEPVIKSPNDDNKYEYFELANQLKVLVISDPDTDKAAASLDVHVGSASDPEDYAGLAHFLEHMLFLGTEKYPQAGEYKQFISTHGGGNNAYTALENTNYYFDIDKDYLQPALDRFAEFFVAPLFTARYVDRERQVVHSEYQANIKSDGWRLRSAQKHAFNPAHPLTKFNVGSLETLADRADHPVREALIEFYQQYYSANLMTLTVLGKEPLDVLKQWVSEKFGRIENRQAQPLDINMPIFNPDSLPGRIDVVPIKESQRLSLSFPVAPIKEHYRKKPTSYIGNLIGHEGKGSLLSLLKSKGWADALSAGLAASYDNEALFNVTITLTPEGLNHIDTMIGLVFQTLHLIEQQGIESWLFEEQQQLADIAFRFQEKTEPINLVRGLSASLHEYPPSEVLRGPYAMDEYDPELIRHYLASLTPDNVFITVTAPGLETDRVDPWFGTAYRISSPDQQSRAAWSDATRSGATRSGETIDEALAIAKPNPFIPEDLSLKTADAENSKPEKIAEQPGFEFWHQQDSSFNVPKAEFYFSVRSPIANDNPKHSVLTELYTKMVNDSLSEFSYPASLAGLDYRLYNHSRGFTVRISGYDDKQEQLLTKILAQLKNSEFDEKRFMQIKDDTMRSLKNSRQNPPYRQVYSEIVTLLLTQSWQDEEKIAALEELTLADLNDFIPELFAEIDLAALAHGNINRPEALRLAQSLQQQLLSDTKPVSVARSRLLKIDDGSDYVRQLEIDNNDSALLVYFQGSDRSYASRARFSLLAQVLESPFFEDLRTENQLGYIVFASPFSLLEVPGLAFTVQSPIADPIELNTYVERFIDGYAETLAQMSEAEFMQHKQGLINRVLQADKTLQERSERYWTELDREEYQFDSRQQFVNAVQEIKQQDLIDTYRQVLLDKPRQRLLVRSIGNRHQQQFKDKQQQQSDEILIADPSVFKEDREAFSG